MTQESITNQVQILIFSGKATFVNYEIALAFVTLIQVLLWSDLENIITHLESNWLYFLGDVLAW